MKNKKGFIICILLLMVIYSYVYIFTGVLKNNIVFSYILFISLIVIVIFLINLIKIIGNGNKNKLFNSLVENSETVYIMLNSKTRKVSYISNNVDDVLGIEKDKMSDDEIASSILNLPIINSELKNWDKKGLYVGQMIQYDNPKYNHDMWIRIKIFNYVEKEDNYIVIEVIDATKEHERQHLLITQATDIKNREFKLNQITAKSYDVEININLASNSYDLKYFKEDNLYFGEEKRGFYSEGLKEILSYINEKDRDMVYSNISREVLDEHFKKFELNSISFRYRIGSDIKNSTWLESTVFFLTKNQRNIVSILTKNVTEDAESIREQNVMLQNALNAAKMADKSKTDLISTISHDIRTPLSNIMGLSESLLKEKLNDNVKEDIKNIKSSSKEVLTIIDGLLDTSKIEKKAIEKEEKNYSILRMFKILEKSSKEYINNKDIKLNINLDNNLPVILYGDCKRITNALTNIINNSIEYTSEGEININVRGEKIDNNVKLIVEISDTGSGIEEERLNSIMNSSSNNSGLGTVKNLMNLLGGTLEIESKVGEYTKVTVTFIQKIVEDNKVREMITNNKNAEQFSLKGKKVLIVDDNKLNLKVTSRFLEDYDISATLIESGIECIDLIKEDNTFDLILLDQMMPGLSGVETLNKLKEIEGFNTPVVVLTADAIKGQKEKYLSDGFDDYLSKPIDKSELSRVLKKFLK